MRQVLIRGLIFATCFSTGVLPVRLPKIATQRSGRFPNLKAAISGINPLTKRLRKIGNLPEHGLGRPEDFICQFVNDRVGWFQNGGKLWRTNDGGVNWRLIYSTGYTRILDEGEIRQLKFISPLRGWMQVDQKLYLTDDGGDTWQTLNVPQMEFIETFDFLPDGKNGWLGGTVCERLRKGEGTANRFRCGNDLVHGALAAMFVTHDSGQTWQRQQVTRRFGDINQIEMRDANYGLAVGQAGVFRYEHGRWLDSVSAVPEVEDNPELMPGEYCEQVEIGMPTFAPISFYFTDSTHGYLANSNGYLGRTNDGGRTWMDIAHCEVEGPHGDPEYFSSFMISLDGDGVALDSAGSLQETHDGGVTWEHLTDRDAFLELFVLDLDKVWLISPDGIYRLDPERFN